MSAQPAPVSITVYGDNLDAMTDDARGQIAALIHEVGFEMRLVSCEPEAQLVTGEVVVWRATFEAVVAKRVTP